MACLKQFLETDYFNPFLFFWKEEDQELEPSDLALNLFSCSLHEVLTLISGFHNDNLFQVLNNFLLLLQDLDFVGGGFGVRSNNVGSSCHTVLLCEETRELGAESLKIEKWVLQKLFHWIT